MKDDVSIGILRPWRGLASLKSSSRGVASPRGISLPCVGTSSGLKGGGRGVACSFCALSSSSSSRGVTRAEAPLNLRSRAAFCEGDAIFVAPVLRARRGAARAHRPGRGRSCVSVFGPTRPFWLRLARPTPAPAAAKSRTQTAGAASKSCPCAAPGGHRSGLARAVGARILQLGAGLKKRASNSAGGCPHTPPRLDAAAARGSDQTWPT